MDEYQEHLHELLECAPATDQAKMLRTFGLKSARAQNWPLAIEQMQQAIQLCGRCEVQRALAQEPHVLYRSTGKTSAAKAELRHTIDLDAYDQKARYAQEALSSQKSRAQ